ncbi:cysteine hydrolase family protein [Brachybacterium sp. YJGR34]|uniref:cysteine hydrolase family protein n=1 Tax=Brachybacterium sp. YJGR34 TaxID=2059911 RepID=UPI000E0C5EE1|nr:isochorismatase family cysteine hydrolase [Brachybacterium sp. YJGR34]
MGPSTGQGPARAGADGSALLLIDLQEAFFDHPALEASRAEVVAAAQRLADQARRRDVPIFLITTEHSRDGSTWTLGMLEAGQGFLFHGDPGTATVAELDTTGMTRIEKTRDSAWFGTDLLLRVRNLEVSRVLIAGVSTHACIAQTARDAYANNVRAAVITDAVADEQVEHKEHVLELLSADRQAELLTTDEVLARWRGKGR